MSSFLSSLVVELDLRKKDETLTLRQAVWNQMSLIPIFSFG